MWQNQTNYTAVIVIDGLKRPWDPWGMKPFNQTNYIHTFWHQYILYRNIWTVWANFQCMEIWAEVWHDTKTIVMFLNNIKKLDPKIPKEILRWICCAYARGAKNFRWVVAWGGQKIFWQLVNWGCQNVQRLVIWGCQHFWWLVSWGCQNSMTLEMPKLLTTCDFCVVCVYLQYGTDIEKNGSLWLPVILNGRNYWDAELINGILLFFCWRVASPR